MSRRSNAPHLEVCEPRLLLSSGMLTRFPGLDAVPTPVSFSTGPAGPATKFVPNDAVKVGPTVTTTTTSPESEEHIAVVPGDTNTLVAAISDFSIARTGHTRPTNTTKYTVSADGGTTWKDAFVPTVGTFPATRDGTFDVTFDANSDPVVAIDNQGRVYLADLYFDFYQDNANGLYVSTGTLTASGLTFTQANTRPVLTNLDPNTLINEDKEWITVDNASGKDSPYSGNVYVSWTHFVTTNPDTGAQTATILTARSTDHGQSWSSPVSVSPSVVFDPTANDVGGVVQFSQVTVGPRGEVYVLYELSRPSSPDVFYNDGRSQLWLVKSTDGGQTFSTPRAVTGVFDEMKYADFPTTFRYASVPAMAVDPKSGDLSIVYDDQVGSESRIEYVGSTDGGTSFSAPVALNDATNGLRIQPAVAADPQTGQVWVSWFDTRNSADLGHYDVYATMSTNGEVFKRNVPVTPQTLDVSNVDFLGDYSGIAAGGGQAHPVWPSNGRAPDRRNQDSHLQTATLSLSASGGGSAAASPSGQAVDAVILAPAGQTGNDVFDVLLAPTGKRRKDLPPA